MTDHVEIDTIGGYCPVQAEGYIITPKGKHRFYFRARGTTISMDVTEDPAAGDPLSIDDQDDVWSWSFRYGWTYEAGWITEAFARGCIDEAASVFVGKVKRELAEKGKGPTPEARYQSLLRETAGERLGATE